MVKVRETIFGSRSERKLFCKLRDPWEKHFNIYPQVPLSAILEIPEDTTKKEKEYFYKTTVDYTLCDKVTDQPILSIEFDGMGNGYNRDGNYVPKRRSAGYLDTRKMEERLKKMNSKLAWAYKAEYPFLVVSHAETQPVGDRTHHMILDAIIGEVVARTKLKETFEELRRESAMQEKISELHRQLDGLREEYLAWEVGYLAFHRDDEIPELFDELPSVRIYWDIYYFAKSFAEEVIDRARRRWNPVYAEMLRQEHQVRSSEIGFGNDSCVAVTRNGERCGFSVDDVHGTDIYLPPVNIFERDSETSHLSPNVVSLRKVEIRKERRLDTKEIEWFECSHGVKVRNFFSDSEYLNPYELEDKLRDLVDPHDSMMIPFQYVTFGHTSWEDMLSDYGRFFNLGLLAVHCAQTVSRLLGYEEALKLAK